MILLFHKVDANAPTQWWVTADAFDRQLADLAGYDVVSLAAYDPGNARHVVITFDGVYENVFQFAFPLLKKRGYCFELFITGNYLGGDNAFDSVEPLAKFCTVAQLEEMAAHGGVLQWHTASHCRLSGLDAAQLERELLVPPMLRSRFASPHFDWFAYPHGDHDAAAIDLVRQNFTGALSCVAGDQADRYQFNRLTVLESSRFARARVTLIVACHNYAAFLPEAMESVLTQTIAPDEIILIDDASTDDSAVVAQRYRDRATVVVNERNLGIVGNFNKAVRLATGDYIAFLGADNRLRCDYVEQCRAALDGNPDAAVAYTDMAIFGHRAADLAARVGAEQVGESRLERWPVYLWRFPEPTAEVLAALRERNFMHGSSMYRRTAFDQAGGYRESGGPEDHHLFARMLALGWTATHVDAPLVDYRQHSSDQANTRLGLQIELARLQQIEKLRTAELAALELAQGRLEVIEAARGAAEASSRQLSQALLDANAQVWTLSHANNELDGIIRRERDDHQTSREVLELGQTELRRHIAVMELGHAELRQHIATSEELLRHAAAQNADLNARHDRAISDIRALVSSRSWKMTRPIRFIGLIARGNFAEARRLSLAISSRAMRRLPYPMRGFLLRARTRIIAASGLVGNTSVRLDAVAQLVRHRNAYTAQTPRPDVLSTVQASGFAHVDVSVVTHNNGKWIALFAAGLRALDYPRDMLHLRFVDNQSTDATVEGLTRLVEELRGEGFDALLMRQPNHGFGAGHNAGIKAGSSPFALVSNIDLVFEPDSLREVVRIALQDPEAAAWEFRQKPYEHPKFYDPVTGATNWNSHACVLLRRSAFEAVGGYDDHIFMYGEDVELSYRFRRAGYRLRYCPTASVSHYAYESAGQVKPVQYIGSTFANLYLRMKYGTASELGLVPLMALGLIALPQAYPGSRKALVRSFARLVAKAPRALAARKKSTAFFPFQVWDYDLRRDGAFVEALPTAADAPLVSIVTRTYAGRDLLLRQAMLSVAHQTYRQIELIVVQDGGDSLRTVVEEIAGATGLRCRFIAAPKEGRSATGNAGLLAAGGRWCQFLDDDDLLFADHVELLVQALQANPDSVAAYSPAWEVETDFPDGPKGEYVETVYTVPLVLKQEFHRDLLRERNYMAIQSVLFARGLFEERGGFDLDMDALEDWILWNVYAHENVFTHVPKVTSIFRTPANVEIRKRRNDIFAHCYDAARDRFAQRIAALPTNLKVAVVVDVNHPSTPDMMAQR